MNQRRVLGLVLGALVVYFAWSRGSDWAPKYAYE